MTKWEVVHNSWEMSTVYSADGKIMAEVTIDRDVDEDTEDQFRSEKEARATMIAAAPNLLGVCKTLDSWWLEDFKGGPDGDDKYAGGFGQLSEDTKAIWRAIRAAIAKAEGRA